MIGNDIVDLDLARIQSNWRRKGFLDKLFTINEQELILNNPESELVVWNLWSRKESAYKAFNRLTGRSGYFPLRIVCDWKNSCFGTVSIGDFLFYTQTETTNSYVYTIAVSKQCHLQKIESLPLSISIEKRNGLPFILDEKTNKKIAVSRTHHGRFERIIKSK
jgi:phosphopantetheinyl transferase (holo-ACP synthase)